METQPTSKETEHLAIYEEKDGDWGGGAPVASSTVNPLGAREGGSQEVAMPGLENMMENNLGTGLPQE